MEVEITKEVTVYSFLLSDVGDHDIWAQENTDRFINSEAGDWLIRNCNTKPILYRIPYEYGWQFLIKAKLTESQYTFYSLKYK